MSTTHAVLKWQKVWAKKLGSNVLEAYSAGPENYPEVKPLAVQVIEEAGVDMSGHYPKLIKRYSSGSR